MHSELQEILTMTDSLTKKLLVDRQKIAITLLFSIAFMAAAVADSPKADEPGEHPTVGISTRITDLILPGSELTSKPLDSNSPIVVRILDTRVHGSAFRYDLVYYGLEPGEFDLRDYLVRIDGGPTDDLPNIPIKILGVLGEGQLTPNDLEKRPPPRVGGYRATLWLLAAFWLIGLLTLIFYPRTKSESASKTQAAPTTLADRLRPYVESATRGELNDTDKAELERLLLAYWHDKLEVGDLPPAQAISKLRNDETAGRLFTVLEQWLHSPDPIAISEQEISELLEPYRNTPVRQ